MSDDVHNQIRALKSNLRDYSAGVSRVRERVTEIVTKCTAPSGDVIRISDGRRFHVEGVFIHGNVISLHGSVSDGKGKIGERVFNIGMLSEVTTVDGGTIDPAAAAAIERKANPLPEPGDLKL